MAIEGAWRRNTGQQTIPVAVMDTGVEWQHDDLSANLWVNPAEDYNGNGTFENWGFTTGGDLNGDDADNNDYIDDVIGWDFRDIDPDPAPEMADDPAPPDGPKDQHGTRVAGVIAAATNNSEDVAGIAGGWNSTGCTIMPLRTFNNDSGHIFDHIEAVKYALDMGARVINMSWYADYLDAMLQIWLEQALDAGLVIVAAAGEHDPSEGIYNVANVYAAVPGVIAVVGVRGDDVKQRGSPWGSYVDIAAPGDTIWTTTIGGTSVKSPGGTPSLATAHVSGLAALILSEYPTLTNSGVQHQIYATADDISAANQDCTWAGYIGHGRINAHRALTEWSGTLSVRPGEVLVWKDTIEVVGDVVVPSGTSLRIDPGTIVYLSGTSDNQAAGMFTDRAELVVHGTLDAQGVTFNSMQGAGAKWGGILLNGGTTTLRGCSISNAVYGTRVATAGVTIGGDALSQGNTYTGCDYGVYVLNAAQTVIKNNTIAGGSYGIYLSGSIAAVANNLLTNNGTYGILVGNQGAVTIQNNTLDIQVTNSATGIYVYNASNATIVNNIAQGFFNGGIRTDSTSSPGIVAQYYLSQGNGTGIPDLAGTLAATRRALFSDPRFMDRPGSDYRLNSSSPGRDFGDPSQNDPNDSRIDLGRYGGTALGDTAVGQIRIEDYFVNGGATGWQQLPGTVGTWRGDAAQG
ncbi:MAG: S8 family serine peptidase, partial [Candidatus Latescibacterota bacterium]